MASSFELISPGGYSCRWRTSWTRPSLGEHRLAFTSTQNVLDHREIMQTRDLVLFSPVLFFPSLSFSHSRFCLSFFLFVLLSWVEIIRIFAWARQLNCLSTSVTAWNSVPRVLREFFLRVLRVPFFFFFSDSGRTALLGSRGRIWS